MYLTSAIFRKSCLHFKACGLLCKVGWCCCCPTKEVDTKQHDAPISHGAPGMVQTHQQSVVAAMPQTCVEAETTLRSQSSIASASNMGSSKLGQDVIVGRDEPGGGDADEADFVASAPASPCSQATQSAPQAQVRADPSNGSDVLIGSTSQVLFSSLTTSCDVENAGARAAPAESPAPSHLSTAHGSAPSNAPSNAFAKQLLSDDLMYLDMEEGDVGGYHDGRRTPCCSDHRPNSTQTESHLASIPEFVDEAAPPTTLLPTLLADATMKSHTSSHREVPVVLSPSSLPQPRPVVCKADIPGSAFAAEPAIMAQLVCIRAIAAQSRKRASYVVASAAAELTSDERRSLPAWVQRSADSAPQFVRRSVKSSEDNQLHQLAASHHLELTSGDLAAEDLVLGYGGRPASFDAAGHRGGGQMEGCRVWSRHGCSSSRRSSILGRSSRLS